MYTELGNGFCVRCKIGENEVSSEKDLLKAALLETELP
jgi:hypothetical protein